MIPPAAVLFDLDDTLYDSSRLSGLARQAAVEAMIEAGLKASEEVALRHLLQIVRSSGANDPSHFDRLLAALGHRRDPRIVAAGIVAYHNTKHAYLRPFVDTVPVLLALRDRGCRLGVVTNGRAVKQWEKLIRLGLQHVFSTVTVSEEIGVEKPDPRMFAAACEAVGVLPSGCWFVGNDPVRDMTGAVGCGMKAIFFRHGRCQDQPVPPEARPLFAEIRTLAELLPLFDGT